MIPTPNERTLEARMAPGALVQEGFLGTDPRRLGDILADDDAAVCRLNTTHAALAARLAAVADAATAGLGTTVSVGEGLTATYHEAMGYLPCPWGGCGPFGKGDIELADARTGRRLRFTSLSVHLIAAHGFYQGRGSRYRLEPEELARLFA